MTDAQLRDQALVHLRRMTVSWKTWEANVKAGKYPDPATTQGGKAKALLDQIGKPPPPAQPPAPTPGELAKSMQRLVVWANVTIDGIAQSVALGPSWGHALSADRGVYRQDGDPEGPLSDEVFNARVKAAVDPLRRIGAPVWSWCDCRPVGGTPATAAIDLAHKHGLDGWIGQAETQDELDHALDYGAVRIFANPNAWDPDERGPHGNEALASWRQRVFAAKRRSPAIDFVTAGKLAVSGEQYEGDPATYSSQGVPIASLLLGIAMDGDLYRPLRELLARVDAAFKRTFCVWHGSGLRTEAWTAMRASR